MVGVTPHTTERASGRSAVREEEEEERGDESSGEREDEEEEEDRREGTCSVAVEEEDAKGDGCGIREKDDPFLSAPIGTGGGGIEKPGVCGVFCEVSGRRWRDGKKGEPPSTSSRKMSWKTAPGASTSSARTSISWSKREKLHEAAEEEGSSGVRQPISSSTLADPVDGCSFGALISVEASGVIEYCTAVAVLSEAASAAFFPVLLFSFSFSFSLPPLAFPFVFSFCFSFDVSASAFIGNSAGGNRTCVVDCKIAVRNGCGTYGTGRI